MPGLFSTGLTAIRNSLKTLVTHVGVATDQTVFSSTQIVIDPANAGAANLLIKTATKTDVDFQTFDATITVTGSSEFTGKTIWTISPCNGSARTDALGRIVRTAGIGVQSGDVATVGIRWKNEDTTP